MRKLPDIWHKSGIYQLLCVRTGRRYIGSAKRLSARRHQHFDQLKRGRHPNSRLRRIWASHGAEALSFSILLVCAPEDLLFYEQRAFDVLQPELNILRLAGSSLGRKYTPEALAAITAGNRKRCADPAFRAMRSAAMTGVSPSAETRARLSAALKGRKRPPEVIAKIRAGRAAAQQARTISGEVRIRRTPEQRARTSAAAKIYMNRPEVKAKISRSLRGRKRSKRTSTSDPSQGVLGF